MYHYVRDLEHSRYPGIKGLRVREFAEQLDYLQSHYVVVRPEAVVAAVRDRDEALPPNAALLTFDDGYLDHYTNVFPMLYDRGLSAMFFPVVRAVRDHRLLDVNKIHFILASVDDPTTLLGPLYDALDEFRGARGLESDEAYYARLAVPNRFDPGEVIFIKRMLQSELPEDLHTIIAQRLFDRFVTVDEETFARELYMTEDQLRTMIGCGMYVGSHGTSHAWLDKVDPAGQAREIDGSLAFLSDLGAPLDEWVMCYPYGASNDTLLNILREKNCAIGLTTEVAIADLDANDPLLLPRLDTNDLPKYGGAEPNKWLRMVMA